MRSASITQVRLVLDRTLVGMMDASTTRRPVDAVHPSLGVDHGPLVAGGTHRARCRRGGRWS